MEALVFGVSIRKGISKKSGNNYEIKKVFILVPIQNFQSVSTDYYGYGLEVREIDLDETVLSQFSGQKYPSVMDLIIEPNPLNPSVNWCRGINDVK